MQIQLNEKLNESAFTPMLQNQICIINYIIEKKYYWLMFIMTMQLKYLFLK